jgi:F0F1-type ATP synthase assembly protein I
MTRRRIFKRTLKFLFFGLGLPAFVMIGLYFGWLLGKLLGRPFDFVFALIGSLVGLILSSVILWRVALKEYRKALEKSETISSFRFF